MKLVLIGSQSLEELENLAIDKFYQVRQVNMTLPYNVTGGPAAFDADNLGKFIWYKPIKNENALSMVFHIPRRDDSDYYKDYMDFMIYYVNSREPGSYFESLRMAGWSTSITARVIKKSSDFDLVVYTVKVTDRGLLNIRAIINYFY